jgi:hypothetical protein
LIKKQFTVQKKEMKLKIELLTILIAIIPYSFEQKPSTSAAISRQIEENRKQNAQLQLINDNRQVSDSIISLRQNGPQDNANANQEIIRNLKDINKKIKKKVDEAKKNADKIKKNKKVKARNPNSNKPKKNNHSFSIQTKPKTTRPKTKISNDYKSIHSSLNRIIKRNIRW